MFHCKMFHCVTFLLQQFFEKCKDGNNIGRLDIVMSLEIQIFLVIVIVYVLMGLILKVDSSFMPVGNKR